MRYANAVPAEAIDKRETSRHRCGAKMRNGLRCGNPSRSWSLGIGYRCLRHHESHKAIWQAINQSTSAVE